MKKRIIALFMLLMWLASFATAQEVDTLTLTFVGDTSIGDAFQLRGYDTSFHGVVREKGLDWPLSLVVEELLGDDLSIANLEGSLTTSTRHKDIRYPLVIDPAHIDILRSGGIEVVNTANNHAFDFFQAGYQDTLDALDAAGIAHFGTLSPPRNTGVNRQVVLERKGIKIGFIGFTYPQQSDLRHIEAAATQLREEGCALLILSLHWGQETYMTPNAMQVDFAKKAMALGIDLIYGHHPHVVQPIALLEGRPVLFSTGNFVFGTMSRVDPSTGLFQVVYDLLPQGPSLAQIRVIPLNTSGAGDYRPTPVTDPAARRDIFRKLTFKTVPRGFEGLPEGFLETGVADLR